ncbi:MAG: hypothetical protein ACI4HI_15245 [Lachnospiraceae bacterium]
MELIEEVKNYLDITWQTTPQEDEKLNGMIERGKAAIVGKIGECDFEKDTQEKTLLLNHVMYERSGALDEFWKNYRGEVISLRIRKRVEKHEKEESEI